jgi:serine/threonine protein kinase
MDELLGKSLGRYQILALLGEGGMGVVYKAYDPNLQRVVAIKVMHSHFIRQSNFKERFLQEGRIAARLDHPCIVQVFDSGQVDSMLFIVMKFIPGDDLGKMLQDMHKQGKWIPINEAVALTRQVAQALEYAHGRGVLHRDIKPTNIMIEPVASEGIPYRPVLTDLGLAKLAIGGVMTETGSSMGTPAYMSPEQALGQELDARSDVYSLGILLYELSVGRVPFAVKSISEAIRCHTTENPPAPRTIRNDLPVELEQVILKALAKSPSDRYEDAASFVKALANLTFPAETVEAKSILGTAVSLVTQYQSSLASSRGSSILNEFDHPVDLSKDQIQVKQPDGSTQTNVMKSEGITIGRDADNDICLNSTNVSRHHARIEYEGGQYKIVDLNSTNGTYLGNARLLPGLSEVWLPGQVLRIGEAYLRLVGAEKIPAPTVYRSDGSVIPQSELHVSQSGGRVGLFMETPHISATPGQSSMISAVIANQGDIVDHFRISISGIPQAWLPQPAQSIQLMPGTQQTVNLNIIPPRSPESLAGERTITLRVSTQTNPAQPAECNCSLTLAPYYQWSEELYPQKIRAGVTGRVTVTNQGNQDCNYKLNWKDRADEINFRPAQSDLSIAAGQSATTEFTGKPKHQAWLGGERLHPFAVTVTSSQGEMHTQNGEIASRARFPAWVIPVMLMLCLLVAGGGIFAYQKFILPAQRARQEAEILQANAARTRQAPSLTPSPVFTDTPIPPETAVPSATVTTPPIPPEGVSLNCDGTYQRYNLSDAGALGKTITVDNWNGTTWANVFTVSSGDPMENKFTPDTGLYEFGGCQKLLVIPLEKGRNLSLSVFEWMGSGLSQVFYRDELYGKWSADGNALIYQNPVYLYGEPTCCPCNVQETRYQWDGTNFVELSSETYPTYSGTPPPECGPTPTLEFNIIIRPTFLFRIISTSTPTSHP